MSTKRSLNFIKCLIMIIAICSSSENKNPKEKDLRSLEIILPSKSFGRINAETASSSTTPTVGTTTPNITINSYEKANSKGGLSTGGIVAIAIPSIAALIGVGVFAALFKAAPSIASVPLQSIPQPNYINASVDQLTSSNPEVVVQQPGIIKQVPVQQVQVVQPVPQQMAVVQDVIIQPTQVVEQVPVIEQAQVQQIVPVE